MSEGGRWRRWWRLGAGLALLATIVVWVDPLRVWQALRTADPGWLCAALLSSTLANVLSAWRWRALVDWIGWRVPLVWAIAVYFRGVAANVVMPGAVVGGDLLRAWQLRRRGVQLREAGVSVVLDRLSGLWMLGVLGIGALAWGWHSAQLGALWSTGWPWTRFPLGVGAGWWWCAAAMLAVLPYALLRLGPPRAWRAWGWLDWWRMLAQHPHATRHYARQVLASLAVQVASVSTFFCSLQALAAPLPWWLVAVAAVPVFVLATVPVSFGGWGTREAAAVAVLAPLGVAAPTALAASLLYGLYPVVQSLLALWPLPAPQAPASDPGGR